MKVLITGCHGQVGTELMNLAQAYKCKAIGFDRDDLDITDKKCVHKTIAQHQPDVVINAAAYTAVDKAESEADTALAVNATAVGYLAKACADIGIPFVHISTDYIFDGSKPDRYSENDAVSPLGVYGKTKLEGEVLVHQLCEKYYILRTSWVFSAHGNNFVKTMLRLGSERKALGVVADQYGKPTSAREIAQTIYMMLKSNKQAWGIYHIAQPDVVSWFGFAQTVFSAAEKQGIVLQIEKLNAIETKDYPTPAQRPKNACLDCSKIENVFDLHMNPWQQSLEQVIQELHDE